MNIYKKGNFIVLLNEAENSIIKRSAANVDFRKFNNEVSSDIYEIFYKDELLATVNFADIDDEFNAAYASKTAFESIFDVNTGFNTVAGGSVTDIKYINNKYNLPTAVNGVITLLANVTYIFTTTVDLFGDRLVCGANTTILGFSSENCKIISTGLNSSTALITSNYSMPTRYITITHGTALDLDGDGVNTALDWAGVNFTDCDTVGTIKDYTNFILTDSAFLNSGNLTFDGTIGTIGIFSSLFNCAATSTGLILPSTLTVSRRFRIESSSFVAESGETGINVSASATIADEKYILDNVNFSGGGTYLSGIDHTSNKALFKENVGIINTAVNGQLYMHGNATATTISAANTFYKVNGTTTASADNSKISHSNNRLTIDAKIDRKYNITCTLSFNSNNGNVCQFGFFDSKLGTIREPSKISATANASGRAESVPLQCVVQCSFGDYFEIHCLNTSGANNITVTDLNFIITEIK
jgi:hypothetical protein